MYVNPACLPVARPARDLPRTRPAPCAISPHAVVYCASTSASAAWAALVPAKRPEV